jgi:hypothetical protein
MDDLLMLRGEDRHCRDCDAVTIFLPVAADGEEAWVCTACDSAVFVPGLGTFVAA